MVLSNEIISILSGGVAGLITDCVLYPFDTIKTRQQSSRLFSRTNAYKKLFAGMSTVIASSIPNAAIFFLTYEFVKGLGEELPTPYIAFIGAISGEITSGFVRCPFERIKQKCQDQPNIPLRSLIKHVIAHEGIKNGFFKGYVRMISREVPFSTIQYPLWEALKSNLKYYRVGVIKPYDAAMCGFIAGGLSAFLTTPLDVAKTKVMVAEKNTLFYSMSLTSTMKQIYLEDGIRGLFSGTIPRVIQISFGGAMFLGSYDCMRNILLKLNKVSVKN